MLRNQAAKLCCPSRHFPKAHAFLVVHNMATKEHGLDREKFAYDIGPHGSFDPNQASADVAVQNMEDR